MLADLGFDFKVAVKPTLETFPNHLVAEAIPIHIAKLKAAAFKGHLNDDDLLITADTVVWHKGTSLGKPKSEEEAFQMLKALSGSVHEVITAVCLLDNQIQESFFERTEVYFKELDDSQINYYIQHYQPFDKAGSYGIQEWIGLVGIEKINGNYHNVMGLPTVTLFKALSAKLG